MESGPPNKEMPVFAQDRLSSLAIIAIEKEIGAQIELNNLINDFTQKNACKIVIASIS